jgi:SAM-dependent methyltransferase
MQALSSVEGGYDLLAPKFDHTPFRTPDGVLDAAAGALRLLGPFGPGLDVCCGTGAGMRVLAYVCQGRLTGVDFSAGMLAQARRAHPAAQWVRADVRAVPFTGAFDLAVSFGALSAVRDDLTVSGFTVTTVPLTALGRRADGRPRYRLVLARRPA